MSCPRFTELLLKFVQEAVYGGLEFASERITPSVPGPATQANRHRKLLRIDVQTPRSGTGAGISALPLPM